MSNILVWCSANPLDSELCTPTFCRVYLLWSMTFLNSADAASSPPPSVIIYQYCRSCGLIISSNCFMYCIGSVFDLARNTYLYRVAWLCQREAKRVAICCWWGWLKNSFPSDVDYFKGLVQNNDLCGTDLPNCFGFLPSSVGCCLLIFKAK